METRFFWTYGFKTIISEKSLNQKAAKGVLDCTFHFGTYKGNPKKDIKEILNPQGNLERQKLYDELKDLRKLILRVVGLRFISNIQSKISRYHKRKR